MALTDKLKGIGIACVVGAVSLLGTVKQVYSQQMQIKTSPQESAWVRDGVTEYRMDVIADSTLVPATQIMGSQWEFYVPNGLTVTRAELPFTQNPSENPNDFFYNFLLDIPYNYVDNTLDANRILRDNCRSVDNHEGAINRENKILGSYYFTVNPTSELGEKTFDFSFDINDNVFSDTDYNSYNLYKGNLVTDEQSFQIIPQNTTGLTRGNLEGFVNIWAHPEFEGQSPGYEGPTSIESGESLKWIVYSNIDPAQVEQVRATVGLDEHFTLVDSAVSTGYNSFSGWEAFFTEGYGVDCTNLVMEVGMHEVEGVLDENRNFDYTAVVDWDVNAGPDVWQSGENFEFNTIITGNGEWVSPDLSGLEIIVTDRTSGIYDIWTEGDGIYSQIQKIYVNPHVLEPATVGLLAVGGLGVLMRRRKR